MKYLLAIFLSLAALHPAAGAAGQGVSFTRDVAPVLVAKCLACHQADKAKGGYRLHTFEALLKPGSSKDAPVRPGRAADSLLFQLLVATNVDDRMPQEDEALPASQIALIRQWIDQGAPFDGPARSTLLAVLAPPRHPAAPESYRVPLPITALAFDPSGEVLVAGGYHELTLWDARSGRLLRRIGNVAERTFDVALSPDGRWLAAASGTPGRVGEVKLFQATNGALARILATTPDAQLAVAFSADGRRLAAGGADHAIRIWDVESGAALHTIEQHADWILALAFSPDGRLLVSGSRDKSARVFDVQTGELETTHNGHGEFVTAVAWADSKFVISASRERTAQRWNARDDKKAGEFAGWDASPTRLIVSSNRLFSAAMDGKILEHQLDSKAVVRNFSGPRDAAHALALHGPSRQLAAGAHDGTVTIWDAADGRVLRKFLAAPGLQGAGSPAP